MAATKEPKPADQTVPPVKTGNRPNRPRGSGHNQISDLGWTQEYAAQVRASLQVFDEDWNAPGMEEYDKL